MARPASQLENQRPSGLKQPSRLPALAVSASVNASRSLLETSQSDLNARTAVPVAGGGGLMGPPVSTIKHRMMGQRKIISMRIKSLESCSDTDDT